LHLPYQWTARKEAHEVGGVHFLSPCATTLATWPKIKDV
jgi:hypothetical protein